MKHSPEKQKPWKQLDLDTLVLSGWLLGSQMNVVLIVANSNAILLKKKFSSSYFSFKTSGTKRRLNAKSKQVVL